jgi:hypothetical protein
MVLVKEVYNSAQEKEGSSAAGLSAQMAGCFSARVSRLFSIQTTWNRRRDAASLDPRDRPHSDCRGP